MSEPKRNKTEAAAQSHRLPVLRFYRGGFVLDTASGMFYRLTPAADYLLRSYDAGMEVREFAQLIQERYGLDHASAVRDVELLLNQFVGPGLLDTRQAERAA